MIGATFRSIYGIQGGTKTFFHICQDYNVEWFTRFAEYQNVKNDEETVFQEFRIKNWVRTNDKWRG